MPYRTSVAGGGGQLIDTVSANLGADTTTTAVPPIYATLFSLGLTTVLASSYLFILFTASWRHTGIGGINVAANFRHRLNGVLLTPGDGTTDNRVTSLVGSVTYSRRVVVAAGLQTVVVEWAGFGLGVTQTLRIDPVTLPDLHHAHLTLQEQAT